MLRYATIVQSTILLKRSDDDDDGDDDEDEEEEDDDRHICLCCRFSSAFLKCSLCNCFQLRAVVIVQEDYLHTDLI